MLQHPNNLREAEENIASGRRKFLCQAGGALLTLSAPAALAGHAHHAHHVLHPRHARDAHRHPHKPHLESHKTLAFEHTHTGDKLKLTYFESGRYLKSALNEINYILRDYRTGDIYPIDLALLDQLHDLKLMLNTEGKPFHIISGYRSPATNNWLQSESSGVASHSLHMEGKAIDIRIAGIDTGHIRNAALVMNRGGVGYYPDSDFVHIDSGRARFW